MASSKHGRVGHRGRWPSITHWRSMRATRSPRHRSARRASFDFQRSGNERACRDPQSGGSSSAGSSPATIRSPRTSLRGSRMKSQAGSARAWRESDVSVRLSRGQTPVSCVSRRRWLLTRRARAMMVLPVIMAAFTASTLLRPDELPRTVLVTPRGTICVEAANSPHARARGLGGRDRLDVDGLLLVWPELGRHPIWTADMQFSLDLLWLDADGLVTAMATHVQPCGQPPCALHEPTGSARSVAVLELRAGDARRRDIAVGTRIQHSIAGKASNRCYDGLLSSIRGAQSVIAHD
jgi:uncharacterized membrane protein (UPF0127 family)